MGSYQEHRPRPASPESMPDGSNDDWKIEHAAGFGQLVRFRRDPLAYVGDLARRSVDVRHITIGRNHIFLINQPDLIRDVLVTHDWNFTKSRGLRSSRPVLGQGMLTSEGELHRRQRRLAQPGFNRERLARYAGEMIACADQAANSWRDNAEYAIDQEMMRLTMQIVGRCLFSANVDGHARDIGATLTQALRMFNRLNSPLAQTLPPLRALVERRARKFRARLDAVLQSIIADHRAHPEQFDDLLSMLMGARDENGATYMSDELLRDEAMTLFLAGHETTANALTWTWYLLSQHPGAQQKLAEELQGELQGRLPTLEDLPRLRYTAQVIRESMRLYPPAWIIGRQAVTAYQLGSVPVPAGSTLFMSPFATQRDERFWSRPLVFDPERWAEPDPARPKFAYFPFGAGTRVCIGEHFAMMEAILVLATIAQRWRLVKATGPQVEMWPQITLRPRHAMHFVVQSVPKMRVAKLA
jgi:cytochrome P450